MDYSIEEFEKDGLTYIRKIYENGSVIEYIKQAKSTKPIKPPEPTEQDILNAEMLLNQTNIINTQKEQDEVLAQLLLNQVGGVNNV